MAAHDTHVGLSPFFDVSSNHTVATLLVALESGERWVVIEAAREVLRSAFNHLYAYPSEGAGEGMCTLLIAAATLEESVTKNWFLN